ncbi:MAG: histidine--tRNA ligase [Candidatus Eremiobacteraeota bacterium]|nr:histidine--tRNA ligase [Candidatus Eremiobacteraeota bacterium]
MSKNLVRPQSISGFAEYLPAEQRAAQQLQDKIRRHFELYGFTPIETPAVERLEVLLAKGGDTDKEMFLLQRLDPDAEAEAKLGLHYDLTVPFARYVAQNFGQLAFPFKRYQMQPCWRGERPQEGRFRQFMQCDIDVVALDKLPIAFDSEIPLVAYEILKSIEIGDFDIRISNRKITQGYLQGLGLPENVPLAVVTRWLDKLEKIGPDKVKEELVKLGLEQPDKALALAQIQTRDLSFVEKVKALGIENATLTQGLEELTEVMQRLFSEHQQGFLVDLSVTRGLDYYTGSVYEIRWNDHPGLGSIGAGGRYDDLAGNYTNHHLPGVGLSLGFTRIFSKLKAQLPAPTPTQVLVTWLEPEATKSRQLASQLRARGINTESYHEPAKLNKQLQYANRKGIPYVLFEADMEVKDMRSGLQEAVDLNSWRPL